MLQIFLNFNALMYDSKQILKLKVTCNGFLSVGLLTLLALNMKNIDLYG